MVGGCVSGGDGAAEGTLARWRRAAAKRIGLSCASFFSYAASPSPPSSKTVCASLIHSLPSSLRGFRWFGAAVRREKGPRNSSFLLHCSVSSDLLCFLLGVPSVFIFAKTRFYIHLCKFLVDCSGIITRQGSGHHFIGSS